MKYRERPNKQMQLTKRKAMFGRPAARASIVCWRFAADLQRSPDNDAVNEGGALKKMMLCVLHTAAPRRRPTARHKSNTNARPLQVTGAATGSDRGCGTQQIGGPTRRANKRLHRTSGATRSIPAPAAGEAQRSAHLIT